MEQLPRPADTNKATSVKETGVNPHMHITRFEGPGGEYEETSFLYEPMERYKDDLARLDIVIGHKRGVLRDAEEKLGAHASVAIDAMSTSKDDIVRKVAYMKNEIDRLEIVRTMDMQRLGLLVQQDRLEQDLLDKLPTDVEH
jgi:hypothetical protein